MSTQPSPINDAILRPIPRQVDESGSAQVFARGIDPIFAAGFSRVVVSRRATGTITGWQIHPRQWDCWSVLGGYAKIVLHDLRPDSSTRGRTWELFLGDDADPALVAIPPGVAHGYKVLRGPLVLLVLVTPDTESDRVGPDGEETHVPLDDMSIGYDWHASRLVRG